MSNDVDLSDAGFEGEGDGAPAGPFTADDYLLTVDLPGLVGVEAYRMAPVLWDLAVKLAHEAPEAQPPEVVRALDLGLVVFPAVDPADLMKHAVPFLGAREVARGLEGMLTHRWAFVLMLDGLPNVLALGSRSGDHGWGIRTHTDFALAWTLQLSRHLRSPIVEHVSAGARYDEARLWERRCGRAATTTFTEHEIRVQQEREAARRRAVRR